MASVTTERKSLRPGALIHFLNIVAFVIIACAFPIILFCYVAARISKYLWIKLLANRFPHLTFVENDSIRTLLDTHRNQGVINVFMTIKGTCDPALIQQALLEQIIEKKDRLGNLRFPKLRAVLLSCWGNYAWAMSTAIVIDNHLIHGSPKFRGRPINDQNIQDHVSDIVSKYLPTYLPPWQIIIIPNIVSSEPKYGLLIRVHHLLLEEEEALNIGDFLLLNPEDEYNDPSSHSSNDDSFERPDVTEVNPLSNVLHTPSALPSLYIRLSDSFSNAWNEFISDYDPIESPKLFKKYPGLFHCIAIFIITLVSTCKEFGKFASQTKTDPASYITYFISIFHREALRRCLTLGVIVISVLISLNPISIFINIIKFIVWINISIFIKFPVKICYELNAFRSCSKHQYCLYPNSTVALLHNYLPLLYASCREVIYCAKLIYMGPMSIVQEIFFGDTNKEEHQLQYMSTCGRKVIAWSQPVSKRWIREIAVSEQVTDTEVLLAMATSCLKEYFNESGVSIPDVVLATARTVTCDTFLASIENNSSYKHQKSGIVYLTLPVGKSSVEHVSEEIQSIATELKRVQESQGALNALSGWRSYITQAVPAVVSRVALNYGTRKYAVAITEVSQGKNRNRHHRTTRWGHTVSSLLCWRPPQGNISMSFTIQNYAGTVRLGVMSDALISPQQHIPARHWARSARRFHAHLPPSTLTPPPST